MKKMTLESLKALYPPPPPHEKEGRDGLVVRMAATKKNHRHNHKPTWKPSKPNYSPAEYRRRHMGKKRAR